MTEALEAAQQARGRLGALTERADLSGRTQPGVSELLIELDYAIAGAQERVASGPVDPAALGQLRAVAARVTEISRIRTRTDRLNPGLLRALTALANGIAAN